MNILFLIGNGFDKNLGLDTSYSDFYRTYIKVETSDEDILKAKESITSSIENWSDLEIALGKFTEQVSSKDDFIKVFEDIGDNLAEYLKEEESKFDYKKLNKGKFFQSLTFPEKPLTITERNSITKFKNNWKGHQWRVNIMTFNYTETIEKMIGQTGSSIRLSNHNGSSPVTLDNIKHIHGYIDKRMVLGVNDQTQIANQTFMKGIDFAEAFIKPFCNETMGHEDDKWCSIVISKANLICVFGSSLGDTDKIWWEQIGERLKDENTRLIIFTRGEEIQLRREYKKSIQKRKIKEHFLQKTKLSKEDKSKLMSRIFIGVNTNIFDLLT